MANINKIVSNTIFLFTGRFSSKIISFVTLILIARYLGDSGYGQYSFAFAYISFFTIISELGVLQIANRELSRDVKNAGLLFGNVIIIKIILSVIAFVLSILIIHLMNYPVDTTFMVEIASFLLLVDIFNSYGIIYESALNMKYSVLFYTISRLLLLFLIYVIVINNYGIYWIITVTVLANLLHNILMFLHSTQTFKIIYRYDADIVKNLIKNSIPLALSSVFVIIYYRIDVIMLSYISGDSSVGIYSAAYRISEAFTFIPNILMISMFPLMSNFFSKSNSSLQLSYLKSLKILVFISLPMALLISLFSKDIIYYIYGNDFIDSTIGLQILIWSTAFLFVNYANGQFFVSVNKQNIVTMYTGIGVVVNILLNSLTIPSLSYVGASLSTVFTELMVLLVSFFYISSIISLKKVITENKVSIYASILMILFLFLGGKQLLGISSIIPAVIIYVSMFFVLGGLTVEDKALISKLTIRKK